MSAGAKRSLSAPPSTASKDQNEDGEEIQQFPSFETDEDDTDLHTWRRGLLPATSTRQSRASSIISTRTRFSTTTLDEVRSIDINAGGHTFRISRDGSKITDTSAPPPYSGLFDDDGEVIEYSVADIEDEQFHEREPRQSNDVHVEPRKRVRIVMPGEEDAEPPHTEPRDSSSKDRVLTKADLYQIMLELPLQLKRILGIRVPGHVQRSQSAEELSYSHTTSMGLTEGSSAEAGYTNDLDGESRPHIIEMSSSYGLAGLQPRSRHDSIPQPAVDYPDGSADQRSSTDTLRVSQQGGDPSEDVHMTVGDLNELSLLYNGVIRDLDREHRRRLHERDKEMERLRSMLNEKDIVYRQQLRGKDFIIEDLKNKLTLQEDSMEKRLEMARNEVEDIWEKRWKNQESHLMERLKRTEDNGSKISKATE